MMKMTLTEHLRRSVCSRSFECSQDMFGHAGDTQKRPQAFR